MAEVLFYALSALAVLFALGVVLAKSPMMSVLNLLGTFFCLSVVYLLCGFQFLAAAQVLVYAGAILVLFLFVIMLLNLGNIDARAESGPVFLRSTAAKVGVAIAIAIALALLIPSSQSAVTRRLPVRTPEGIDDLTGISAELFGRYSLPFEAMSVLLLATMVAVIVLAKRQRGRRDEGAR
jgi:NADH-quinone oxidoreductase subunit J